MKIAEKTVVKIDYTLTHDDGTVIDSSEGNGPLTYLQGADNIIPGLEEALTGKSAGDELKVSVTPEKGYGERSDEMQQEVPRNLFEGIDKIEAGMQFQSDTEQGPVMVTVVAVTDETVTVDGNHPLAGVNLNFEVSVLEVREATDEEMEHGHVHGEGGHQH